MIEFPLRHRLRMHLRRSFLRKIVVAYRHVGVRSEDVMLASYPKSGTTWLAFMLAQLLWCKGREQKLLDHRFLPLVGRQHQAERTLLTGGRMIRTHEPYRPGYRKAIYLVRDGRDVAVSMYWHVQRATGMKADFSDYLTAYLAGWLTGAGAWHRHVSGWLDSKAFHNGDVLLIRYESMKEDAERELRRAARFLAVDAEDAEIADALDAGSMESMKDRERVSEGIAHLETGAKIPVVRKGIVGDWHNYFSDADLRRFYEACGATMQRVGYDCSSADPARAAETRGTDAGGNSP